MFLIGAAVQSSGLPPSFYGSLIGSFFSGSVAVGILIYNNWQKNKEFNFRCYGTMKVINFRMTNLSELENLTVDTLRRMTEDPEKKEIFLDILTTFGKRIFVEHDLFLEKERANIPYDFTNKLPSGERKRGVGNLPTY
ncbi:hypothetical protein [Peribacillus simplex]|uniref:hypothetical protein n=1 Tax=Peribacillus simplex TaxID=1478 RepID=UPI0024C161E5|nr:hypothetical protein [Peribacillus simplex]WHY58358.1 hypothetical protein QNH43_08880 [Peribacillus simplex]